MAASQKRREKKKRERETEIIFLRQRHGYMRRVLRIT